MVEEEARVGLGDSRFIHKYELLGRVRDTHAEAPLEALYYISLPGDSTQLCRRAREQTVGTESNSQVKSGKLRQWRVSVGKGKQTRLRV